MTDGGIGLAEAIAALREELLRAIDEGAGSRMRFQVAPIEISLQVGVVKAGNGRIGWQVLEVGGSYTKSVTQTLTLRLEPSLLTADGSRATNFAIADLPETPQTFGPRG